MNNKTELTVTEAQAIVDRQRAKSRLPLAAIRIIEKNEIGWKIEMNSAVWQMKSTWNPGDSVRSPEVVSCVKA